MPMSRLSGASSAHLARRFKSGALVVSVALATFFAGRNAEPAHFDLAAQPNGIAVRADDGALFVTDDRRDAILWSPDRTTWKPYASLPAIAGQPSSLSQLVFAQPDTLLVERFGFGTTGALFVVPPAGNPHALTGLATDRRRLGLASIGQGRALSSWFVKVGSQPPAGGVSLVRYDISTYAAVEHDLILGLAKPVGIAVQGDMLYVADQRNNMILRYDLTALLAALSPSRGGTPFTRIESPDLLAVDRTGTLYTKCHAHGFCSIAPDGTVTGLENDFQDARGVAVDDMRHVLYVVDRAKPASGETSAIHLIPLNTTGTTNARQESR